MVKSRCDRRTAECVVLEQHEAQLRGPAPVAGQRPAHDVVAEVEQLQRGKRCNACKTPHTELRLRMV